MTQSARDLENTFARASVLLARNPVVIVPGLILGSLGALAGLAILAIGGSAAIGGLAGDQAPGTVPQQLAAIGAAVVASVIALLVLICAMAYVTGMAGAAWNGGKARLRDGWKAFDERGLQLLCAIVLLFAIGLIAALLAPLTRLVSVALYSIFTVYTMAAVVIGGRNAIVAVRESVHLAWTNLLPTVAVVALVVLVAFVGAWIGGTLGRIWPPLAGFATAVVQQIVVAYAALVVTGEYLKLRAADETSKALGRNP